MKTMTNRLFSIASIIVLAFGVFFLSSCKDQAIPPEPTFFAQIRVMNFTVRGNPYDIYYYAENGPVDTLPRGGIALPYGHSTVYINNLATNKGAGQTYTVIARASGSKVGDLVKTSITLKAGDKQTLIIYSGSTDDPQSPPEYQWYSDLPTSTLEKNKSYFRFFNSIKGDTVGPLTVRVGDPIGGEVLAQNIAYKQMSTYYGLPTALDTTVTFYVIKGDGTVLGRMSGISLEAGSLHTVTWGGNWGPPWRQGQADGDVKDDSDRVRIFDDNTNGADVTFPVPLTMRYNFVNAIVPPENPLPDSIPDYNELSIKINNNTRFDVAGMKPFSTGPYVVDSLDLGSNSWKYDVVPASTQLTAAVNVKALLTSTPDGRNQNQIIADYIAGKRSDIINDMLTTLIVHDTVPKLYKLGKGGVKTVLTPIDSSRAQFIVAVPDVPDPNKPTIVLINALAPVKKVPATQNNITYTVNGTAVPFTGTWSPKNYKVYTDASSGTVNITATLKTSPSTTDVSTSFEAQNGEIYEVILCGRVNDGRGNTPRYIVIHANPK
jgi:hypothetical protein